MNKAKKTNGLNCRVGEKVERSNQEKYLVLEGKKGFVEKVFRYLRVTLFSLHTLCTKLRI